MAETESATESTGASGGHGDTDTSSGVDQDTADRVSEAMSSGDDHDPSTDTNTSGTPDSNTETDEIDPAETATSQDRMRAENRAAQDRVERQVEAAQTDMVDAAAADIATSLEALPDEPPEAAQARAAAEIAGRISATPQIARADVAREAVRQIDAQIEAGTGVAQERTLTDVAVALDGQPGAAEYDQALAENVAETGNVQRAADIMAARPNTIDTVLNEVATTRPGLVPDLIVAAQETIADNLDIAAPEPSFGTRAWGALRTIGGGLEAAAGAVLVAAPEPTVVADIAGVAMAVHGADHFTTGLAEMWTGLPQESRTQQVGEAIAAALGADPITAERIGIGLDIGVGLGAAGLGAISRLGRSSATVWDSITPTQPLNPGTVVPRSFEMATPAGNVWVHGNGTKHLAEYATGMLGRGVTPELVNVGSQVQLASLREATSLAMRQGVVYDDVMRVGGWEIGFAAPRAEGLLPVVKHALPLN